MVDNKNIRLSEDDVRQGVVDLNNLYLQQLIALIEDNTEGELYYNNDVLKTYIYVCESFQIDFIKYGKEYIDKEDHNDFDVALWVYDILKAHLGDPDVVVVVDEFKDKLTESLLNSLCGLFRVYNGVKNDEEHYLRNKILIKR